MTQQMLWKESGQQKRPGTVHRNELPPVFDPGVCGCDGLLFLRQQGIQRVVVLVVEDAPEGILHEEHVRDPVLFHVIPVVPDLGDTPVVEDIGLVKGAGQQLRDPPGIAVPQQEQDPAAPLSFEYFPARYLSRTDSKS